VWVETVQGEGGVNVASSEFLQGLREITSASGALLMVDEVQTGIWRTGKFLGVDHSGVKADAVALAKGMGGGVPIGAMLCREALAKSLPPGSHGSTFGGGPLQLLFERRLVVDLQLEQLVGGAYSDTNLHLPIVTLFPRLSRSHTLVT
jgi:acetylornithine/succinyldiaminopimelate/putrescine aminotransferase